MLRSISLPGAIEARQQPYLLRAPELLLSSPTGQANLCPYGKKKSPNSIVGALEILLWRIASGSSFFRLLRALLLDFFYLVKQVVRLLGQRVALR